MTNGMNNKLKMNLEKMNETIEKTTKSGRVVRPPTRYRQNEYNAVSINYYDVLSSDEEDERDGKEMNLIGASIGSGIQDTWELNVMNYNRAMKSEDKEQWEEAIKKEHERMVMHKVWEPVSKHKVKNKKILTSTWAMKKKADRKFRARINARGYKPAGGNSFQD